MPLLIEIKTGEMAVGHNDTRIRTGGIGSCVVIVLYDAEVKAGGMAHCMLPSRRMERRGIVEVGMYVNVVDSEGVAKYVDEAISHLVKEIEKIGGQKARLTAKILGGSSMFKTLSGSGQGIGHQNVEAAKKCLHEIGIEIKNEETGGTVGRLAEVNLENGLVEISTKI